MSRVDINMMRKLTFMLPYSAFQGTIPNAPEKFRKQVIKTFSTREGWWYIGIWCKKQGNKAFD